MKKILVIGGAGYVGSVLVPKLLKLNYTVSVFDLMIFGNNLQAHNNLNILKSDIRNLTDLEKATKNHDVIIHLACISNDPSFELNPKLGSEINFECFEPLVKIAKQNGIKHFIYASSSSVYGIKKENNVTEESILEPITDYSKFKAKCEDVLLKYSDNNFIATIIRPATVCGYSRRQRLDLVVNILTNLAYHTKKIKIFGGSQLRPNIHIDDMADAYIKIIETDINKIKNDIFNIGFENHPVEKLALIVKDKIKDNVELEYIKTDDNRSYHISSKKITKLTGFVPKKNISDAVTDLVNAFDNKLLVNSLENEDYFNIKKMQSINLK